MTAKTHVTNLKDVQILGSFDETNCDYVAPFFLVKDGSKRIFKFVEFSDVNYKKSPVIFFEKHIYRVKEVSLIDVKKVFEFHKFNVDEIIESLMNEWIVQSSVKNISQRWGIICQEYKDLIEWQKQLNEISDGYVGVHKNDMKAIVEESKYLRRGVEITIENIVKKDYFSYSDSFSQDLSVFDGVIRFDWLMGLEFNNFFDEFFHKLGEFETFWDVNEKEVERLLF